MSSFCFVANLSSFTLTWMNEQKKSNVCLKSWKYYLCNVHSNAFNCNLIHKSIFFDLCFVLFMFLFYLWSWNSSFILENQTIFIISFFLLLNKYRNDEYNATHVWTMLNINAFSMILDVIYSFGKQPIDGLAWARPVGLCSEHGNKRVWIDMQSVLNVPYRNASPRAKFDGLIKVISMKAFNCIVNIHGEFYHREN